MNFKIGCQGKLNSKAFRIGFLSVSSLLLFSFYYSLLVYLVWAVFLIRKVERKGKKPWYFYLTILLNLSWLGRIVLFYRTNEQHKDCVHTATPIIGQYFETATWRESFSCSGIFKIVFHSMHFFVAFESLGELVIVSKPEGKIRLSAKKGQKTLLVLVLEKWSG